MEERKKHSFFIESLMGISEEEFLFNKNYAVKLEENRKALIKASIRNFLKNDEEIFNFSHIFKMYDGYDGDKPISVEIEKDFNDFLQSDNDWRVIINSAAHGKDNYSKPFYYGVKSIRSYRLYYAIIIAIYVLNSGEFFDKRLFYTNLFSELEIPDEFRRGDFLCESYDLSDKDFWNERGIILVVIVYLALLFENKKDSKGFKELEKFFKANLSKAIRTITPEIDKCEKNTIDSLRYLKKVGNMKLSHREEIEKRIGGVRNLFFKGNKRIVKEATFIMYTGSSFLNVPNAEGSVSGRLVTIEPVVYKYLKDGGKLKLILTDPFSYSADEAVHSKKLGNRNDIGQNTPFSMAHEMIKSLADYENLEIKYTNISLPYSIMKIDFINNYSDLNFIKTDLYSYGIKSNRGRLSTIIFEEGNPYPYDFLDKNIDFISQRAYEIDNSYTPNITIIHKDDYKNTNKVINRTYFTGQTPFEVDRNNNINNSLSNIEFGMSIYNQDCVDTPHYHRTTNEHYMIIDGEQTIIDKRTGKPHIAKEGDIVFIPKLIPHETSAVKNTRIVFAKSPFNGDKEKI